MDDLINELKSLHSVEFIEELKSRKVSSKRIDFDSGDTILIDYQDVLNSFQTAQQNKEVLMMLLGENGDPGFYTQLRQSLIDLLKYFFEEYAETLNAKFPGVPEDYLEIILYGTLAEIVLHWIKNGMQESTDLVGKIISSAKIVGPLSLLKEE
ncbi:TetR-like C-terminal domain-containing protein [Candidatus Enterococcus ferrettii]|uniref:Transcriptional regulator TetR C-terminal Firmicutes type domain-containing protein n=1 Tax=Candidatus Enterococcus ferrettii TaxID=2815324 RepID=A0ABV0EXC7_9ENTE|nr:TetR-like C-terminal domain-containing protein [Enterococcus sp. 665A]MBO1339465.1 TetR family transcriptional regulator C-terminal domain-containing protein [Enterococcus sp. 665A]